MVVANTLAYHITATVRKGFIVKARDVVQTVFNLTLVPAPFVKKLLQVFLRVIFTGDCVFYTIFLQVFLQSVLSLSH
jgi:hypothetical protein